MSLYTQIPDIMDRFDFEKVLKVMHFLNWTWMGEQVTLDQLKNQAQYLLTAAATEYQALKKGKEYGYSVATGGFTASVETYSDGRARLSLLFYVDDVSGQMVKLG